MTTPAARKPARYTEYVPIDSLAKATRNPKRHDFDSLRQSVSRWGYTEPGLLDERTGRLVAGHGRLETLQRWRSTGGDPPDGIQVREDGMWLVPVTRGWSSKDDREAEAYLLASNRLTEQGGWDDAALDAMLADVNDTELGLVGTGFELEDDDGVEPETTREDVSRFTNAHALISYPPDLHADVVRILDQLADIDDVEVRTTAN